MHSALVYSLIQPGHERTAEITFDIEGEAIVEWKSNMWYSICALMTWLAFRLCSLKERDKINIEHCIVFPFRKHHLHV